MFGFELHPETLPFLLMQNSVNKQLVLERSLRTASRRKESALASGAAGDS
jgi:hypothetical protein